MSKGKSQSIIIIGFGLIVLSGIVLYYALSSPRVSVIETENSSTSIVAYNDVQASSQNTNNAYENTVSSSVTVTQGNTQPAESADDEVSVSYPLNLNTCTAQELMTISGIGEVKAAAIIEYREYLGGYTSVEQLKNIKGIGDKIYEKISPYLTV